MVCCSLLAVSGILCSPVNAGTPESTAKLTISASISLTAYSITVTDIGYSRATIIWKTNGNATGTVEYGLTTSYGSTQSDAALETNHIITLDGLVSHTLYHYRVVSTDRIGTRHVSADYTFRTLGLKPSPSGGGGPSLAAAVASKIKAGENVSLKLDTGYSALSRVVVTAKEDIRTILITAEETALPRSIKAPENKVYQYIEVTLYKVTDASIAQAILDFDIRKSWLDQNGYGISDIVMMRYHDGAWQHLTTEFVKEEHGRVYYRALSPGLSYFAIAYVEGGTVTGDGTPVIPVPTEPGAAATTTPPAEATPAPGFAAVLIPGFGAAAALAGLGAAAFIVLRRR